MAKPCAIRRGVLDVPASIASDLNALLGQYGTDIFERDMILRTNLGYYELY